LGVVAALLWSRRDSSVATAQSGLPATAQAHAVNAQATMPAARTPSLARSAAWPPGTASATATATPPPGTPLPCGARVAGAIPAAAAGDFVDTYQAVEFEVVKTKDTGKVTFLNSHEPYQGHFYIAIFPTDYALYPEPPALYFRGKCIVVQGTIELYRGAPQMVLRSPDDVRTVDEAQPRQPTPSP
jgi:micrococcal nuclease